MRRRTPDVASKTLGAYRVVPALYGRPMERTVPYLLERISSLGLHPQKWRAGGLEGV